MSGVSIQLGHRHAYPRLALCYFAVLHAAGPPTLARLRAQADAVLYPIDRLSGLLSFLFVRWDTDQGPTVRIGAIASWMRIALRPKTAEMSLFGDPR